MSDSLAPRYETWHCQGCGETAVGVVQDGWTRMPQGWFFVLLDETVKGGTRVAAACSEECVVRADRELTDVVGETGEEPS